MDVETTYKFDGDAKVSEVSDFLRERHVRVGWSTDAEPKAVGGYSRGALRLVLVEKHEPSGD